MVSQKNNNSMTTTPTDKTIQELATRMDRTLLVANLCCASLDESLNISDWDQLPDNNADNSSWGYASPRRASQNQPQHSMGRAWSLEDSFSSPISSILPPRLPRRSSDLNGPSRTPSTNANMIMTSSMMCSCQDSQHWNVPDSSNLEACGGPPRSGTRSGNDTATTSCCRWCAITAPFSLQDTGNASFPSRR